MDKNFNPHELISIAVNVEKDGKALYEFLEKKALNKKIKDIWKYLKEQEEIHGRKFQEILDNLKDYLINDYSTGDYDAYLKAIASLFVFVDNDIKNRIKKGFKSDLEALDFGIKIEKDSILTYSALKPYMLTQKQEILDNIIEEEKKHLVQLLLMRNSK